MGTSFETGVFEAMLPFAALLAGSGFGQLIKRYITVGKGAGEEGDQKASRPRIQVTGPKVQVETCQICMGKVKEGTEYVRCTSGKVFHAICLARVGECPYCRRTVAVKGNETATARDFIMPIATAPVQAAIEAPEAETPSNPCPVCGRELEANAKSCSCGVIFVNDGGSFACPACGEDVTEGDAFCGRCGEHFERLSAMKCPVCGRAVTIATEVCACGAILDNLCPECGAGLKEGATSCSACGSEFEFV